MASYVKEGMFLSPSTPSEKCKASEVGSSQGSSRGEKKHRKAGARTFPTAVQGESKEDPS